MTMTLGWGAMLALLGWSAFVFWLGRMSGGGNRDLSGPPASLSMPRRAPPPAGASSGRDPVGLSSEQLAAIRAELARGHKIEAIKLMREATGLGLAEAKQAVEAMGS
jgi:hypothetical protein